ncbi:MAG: DUF2934 domain-containing protein [Rhizobiaceae bacterium]|nr:DUF2934 domain-containing protein [Rhizobiaceae bacterium]MCV0407483.1 DUF2934 domain-containing protein [Rhizobiaceae bacterium]
MTSPNQTGTGRSTRHQNRESEPWEKRHKNDARGPLAANASGISDRSSRDSSGSAGEAPMLHPSGYQEKAGPTPDYNPAPAPDASGTDPLEGKVRDRAYQLWEEAGRPDGDQEKHWHEARRQIEDEENRDG